MIRSFTKCTAKSEGYLFLGILVLAVFLGLFRIQDFEENADGGVILPAIAMQWGTLFRHFFLVPDPVYGGSYPPLYFILIKSFSAVFGGSVLSFRLFSVMAFLALLWITRNFLMHQTKSWHWSHTWALLAIASSPVLVWWAQTAKYNMWSILFSVATLVAGAKLLTKPNLRAATAYALMGSAAFYTHYMALFLLAASAILILLLNIFSRIGKLKFLVMAQLLLLVFSAPLMPTFLKAHEMMRKGSFASYVFPEASPEFPNILRGILIDSIFGFSTNPEKGVWDFLVKAASQGLSGIPSGEIQDKLPFVALLALEAFLVAFILVISLPAMLRDADLERKVTFLYIYSIGPAALSLAAASGLVLAFRYFGFLTWTFLMTAFFLFSRLANLRAIKLVAGSYFLFASISLGLYYSGIENKFPGLQNVNQYFHTMVKHPETTEPIPIYIDEWITQYRMSQLPNSHRYIVLNDVEDISGLAGQKSFYAVIAGRSDLANERLRSWLNGFKRPFASNLLQSWKSLESDMRSVHLFKVVILSDRLKT